MPFISASPLPGLQSLPPVSQFKPSTGAGRLLNFMVKAAHFLVFLLPGRRSTSVAVALSLVIAPWAQAEAQTPKAAPEAASAPSATGPGSVVRATHGAWQVTCRTPPGAKEEKCALVQKVTAEDRKDIGLTVVFYKAVADGKKLLRVVVPLGVLLTTGLGFKIDGQDVGNAPFVKCGSQGCFAEAVLQDEVIEKMKKGTTAIFVIFITPEAGIGIPVALQGFGDALADLK